MPSSSVILQAIDRTAADAVYAELVKFVSLHSPGVVEKQLDTVQNFDAYLKTPNLQNATTLVQDFLGICNTLKLILYPSVDF